MTLLKRNCPACGNDALPVYSRSRKKKRNCSECGAEFTEYPGTGCLIYPIILVLGFSSLLFGPAISIPVIHSDAVPFVIFIIFILAFIIPSYFLNATLPLRLSKLPESEHKKLGFKDKIYRFPIVLILFMGLAVLALHTCSETFFPKELRELASTREIKLSEFRNVLLAYKEKNGCYPRKLTELIPDYVESIPREIDPEIIWGSNLYAIHYHSDNCAASFAWDRCNGPDCGSQFSVEKGEFRHDM